MTFSLHQGGVVMLSQIIHTIVKIHSSCISYTTRFTVFRSDVSRFTIFACLSQFVLCSHARMLGKHSCMSSTFLIAILNGTFFFLQGEIVLALPEALHIKNKLNAKSIIHKQYQVQYQQVRISALWKKTGNKKKLY